MKTETWFHVCGIEHEPDTLRIVEAEGDEFSTPPDSVWQSLSRLSAEDFIKRSHDPQIQQVNVLHHAAFTLLEDGPVKDDIINDINDLYADLFDRLGY